MTQIPTVIATAVLIEGLVEYGKSIEEMFSKGETKKGVIQLTTILLGVLMAFAFNADVFVPVGMNVNHIIGMVLTGVIMSRGSNYVSDLIGKLGAKTIAKN